MEQSVGQAPLPPCFHCLKNPCVRRRAEASIRQAGIEYSEELIDKGALLWTKHKDALGNIMRDIDLQTEYPDHKCDRISLLLQHEARVRRVSDDVVQFFRSASNAQHLEAQVNTHIQQTAQNLADGTTVHEIRRYCDFIEAWRQSPIGGRQSSMASGRLSGVELLKAVDAYCKASKDFLSLFNSYKNRKPARVINTTNAGFWSIFEALRSLDELGNAVYEAWKLDAWKLTVNSTTTSLDRPIKKATESHTALSSAAGIVEHAFRSPLSDEARITDVSSGFPEAPEKAIAQDHLEQAVTPNTTEVLFSPRGEPEEDQSSLSVNQVHEDLRGLDFSWARPLLHEALITNDEETVSKDAMVSTWWTRKHSTPKSPATLIGQFLNDRSESLSELQSPASMRPSEPSPTEPNNIESIVEHYTTAPSTPASAVIPKITTSPPTDDLAWQEQRADLVTRELIRRFNALRPNSSNLLFGRMNS